MRIEVDIDKKIIFLMLSHFTGLPPDEVEDRIRRAVEKLLAERPEA